MKCCIFGAAGIYDYSICLEFLTGDVAVICADNGLRHAKALGIRPDLVIGDFDSIDRPLSSCDAAEILTLPKEKDDTDIYFAVREVLRRGFSDITFFGVLGGRFDHSLANISTLYFLRRSGGTGRIVDEKNRIEILLEGEQTRFRPTSDYQYISLLPYAGEQARVKGEGLYYPLPPVLSSDFPVGVSNIINAENCSVYCEKGTVLIIFSKD